MHCSSVADPESPPPIEDVRLVPMEEDDLDGVVAIEQASFLNPWRREHFLSEIRDNKWAVNYAARRDREIVGYACVWHLDQDLKINNIAVKDGCRGRGLGTWILRQVMQKARLAGCRTARLEVRPSNVSARRMYAREGFTETGRRKGYYAREQEDAILLDAPL